jgi:hypothetical protein
MTQARRVTERRSSRRPGGFLLDPTRGLIDEVPELTLAYDRLHVWDWYFEHIVDLMEKRPYYETRYVMDVLIESGVIAPISWPLADDADQAPLYQYANLVGNYIADGLVGARRCRGALVLLAGGSERRARRP